MALLKIWIPHNRWIAFFYQAHFSMACLCLSVWLMGAGASAAAETSVAEARYPADVLQAEQSLPAEIDYNFHVKPILADRCYLCHGPDVNTRIAELRLDQPDSAYGPLLFNQGRAIVPGKPDESFVMLKTTAKNPDERMPPEGTGLSLSAKEIATLKRWIEQGAQYKPHWSYIPLELNEPFNGDPAMIDERISEKLRENKLDFSPEADRETWLRRVTFDLTGLPPTIREIDAFLADESGDAHESVVDRLLDSPRYGERMAINWLDVARYADTYGYQADNYRPAWRWRDWVIQAFNENRPFDEFLTEQLAGDLLPNPSAGQIIATGFNRNHPQNAEGGIISEEFRVEYAADRTNTFGRAFLGMTMECARCHDHKYDPISQKDYYSLFSFFNNVDESGQITWSGIDMPAPTLTLPTDEQQANLDEINQRIAEVENRIQSLRDSQRPYFKNWLAALPNQGKILDLEANDCAGRFAFETPALDRITNEIGGATGRVIDPVTMKHANQMPEQVDGINGKALRLDGDSALDFPGLGRFAMGDPFSIGLWIKVPNELNSGVVFHSNKGGIIYSFKGYQVSIEDGRFDVRLAHSFPYNSIHLISENPAPKDRWTHLMLTYGGSSKAAGVSLYVDGERQAMAVMRDNLYKDIVFNREGIATNLRVGARWRTKGFSHGAVDELAVFERELSPLGVMMEAALPAGVVKLDSMAEGRWLDFYLSNVNIKRRLAMRELRRLRTERNAILDRLEEVMVMAEMPTPRPAFLLERGAYDAHGAPVSPSAPKAALEFSNDLPPNRLGLARWLMKPENPLTARVFMNRLWQQCFGRGLVGTAEDFGSQGETPTHPKLLDGLASRFIASGWDVKAMLKMIVLSKTYRQSSRITPELLERDPQNIWLARGPSRRLTAEMLRDQALAASGLLTAKIGGPSVKPYQPEGLWSFGSNKTYQQDKGEDLYRRSLYTFWKRTVPPPTMNLFDAPTRSYCVVRRERTNTPLQALALMNDPQFVEAARALAERVVQEAASPEKRIELAFRRLATRKPGEKERALLLDLLRKTQARFVDDPGKAQGVLTAGESRVDESLSKTEVAAYAVAVGAILNSDAGIRAR